MSVKTRVLKLLKQTDKLVNKLDFRLINKSEIKQGMAEDKRILYIYFNL